MLLAVVIVLFLLGLLLVAVEIYVPGGIVGTVGALFLVAANLLVYQSYGSGMLAVSVCVTIAGILLAVIAGFVVLPRTSLGRVFTLGATHTQQAGFVSARADLDDLIGKTGVTQSPLRPSGVALIDGKRTDVIARDAFVPAGTAVQVVAIEAGRVVVKPLDA